MSHPKRKKLRKSEFIDDEAECSDVEDEEIDDENEDLSNFIDDRCNSETDMPMYHDFDNSLKQKNIY